MASCACCPAFRPRYKRLVDNIFPSNPSEGLVRSEMEKLTYYAVSAPEKLDRIGVYLARRLTRDMVRRRNKSVFIAMEALNQLLLACHAQQINLFVESFLRMVAELLESDDHRYLALATLSFEKFSKIEEDTASYHRRYDFFVSKFSSMCHSNADDADVKNKVQLYGVHGLRGVIRKTVSDELQVNIWEKQHMDKIIPSLLYSMQNDLNPTTQKTKSEEENETPSALAEESLRELLSRAAFANVPAAISPALSHMDHHNLWAPDNSFAIKAFKIIMYSVQSQYSHVIVKLVLDHIDKHKMDDHGIKASMLEVLCAIIPIPSSTSIGPSVIDVYNKLSHHLMMSVEMENQGEFQKALILTTGVLSEVVPDYQKLEAMSFFISKASEAVFDHDLKNSTAQDLIFAKLLLQCLEEISSKYKCNSLSFISTGLLDSLFKMSLQVGPSERLICQKVLIALIDKNQNSKRLKIVDTLSEVEELNLISSTPSRADSEFLDHKINTIYCWLFDCFSQVDNTSENMIFLFKSLSALCLSAVSPDVILELLRIVLAAQSFALDLLTDDRQPELVLYAYNVLMTSSACMLLLAHQVAIPELQHYVSQVMSQRETDTSFLIPSSINKVSKEVKPGLDCDVMSKVIFTTSSIADALKGRSGFAVEKLNQPITNYQTDTVSADGFRAPVDIESINIELPLQKDKSAMESGAKPVEAITYTYLKEIMEKPMISRKEQMEKNQKVAEHVRSVPFEQLMAEMKPDASIATQNWVKKVMESEDFTTEDEGLEGLQFPDFYTL